MTTLTVDAQRVKTIELKDDFNSGKRPVLSEFAGLDNLSVFNKFSSDYLKDHLINLIEINSEKLPEKELEPFKRLVQERLDYKKTANVVSDSGVGGANLGWGRPKGNGQIEK